MKEILIFVLGFAALFMSGCSGTKPMYEYAGYSESFYQLKQNGDAQAQMQWKNTLEESIEKSNAQAIRIPPGINANLGYIYLKLNDTAKAISYFKAEKALYPESGIFMDRLIKKAELLKRDES